MSCHSDLLRDWLYLQQIHERLAAESSNPENYNQISTLVDIAMEFVLPNHELRSGSIMEESQKVRPA